MNGRKDDELATRWVQLGVFSPILRLHSSDNLFNTKEPWKFGHEACEVMIAALKLRHRTGFIDLKKHFSHSEALHE